VRATPFTYPVVLEPDDNGTVMATLPDFPGATFGETREDALAHARDLLITALEDYMSRRQDLPTPSAGRLRVGVPPSVALKVAVYQEMLRRRMTKTALAARMHQPKQQLDRLFNLKHRSRADQIDAAYDALGLTVCVVGAELGQHSPRVPARAFVGAGQRTVRKTARKKTTGSRKG
jgi:antitoxin HicB